MSDFLTDEQMMSLQGSAPSSNTGFISDSEMLNLQKGAQQTPKSQRPLWKDLGVSVAQGATLGFADEGAAALRSAFKDTTYNQELEAIRGGQKNFAKEHPVLDAAANVGGSFVLGGGIGAIGKKAATSTKSLSSIQKIAKAIGAGTAGGAAAGFAQGEGTQDRFKNAATGALVGGGTGALFSGIGAGLGRKANKLQDSADETLEKGLGLQYGAKKRGLNKIPLYVNEAGEAVPLDKLDDAIGVKAPLQLQVKSLKDAGVFKDAPNDIQKLSIHVKTKGQEIGQNIQDLEKAASLAVGGKQIAPRLDSTDKLIKSFNPSEQLKLSKIADTKWQDYIDTPGEGFNKLTTFLNRLQKETNYDQLTPRTQTQLKRALSYDFRKAAEETFDAALPERAGQYAKANELFAATQQVGKTLNGPLAKRTPEFGDFIQGGSLPMTVITGAGAGIFGGIGPAATVGGGKLLYNAGKQYAKAAYPISVAKALENSSKTISKTLDKSKGTALKSAIAASLLATQK